jgi:CMP-N-acetylneuraminate monooxygenase
MQDFMWVKTSTSTSEFSEIQSKKIVLSNRLSIWIVSHDNGFKAFEDKCAHMGYPIKFSKHKFVCPTHNWTYETDGRNCDVGNPNLNEVSIKIENGVFLAHVKSSLLDDPNGESSLIGLERSPNLRVHSHACVELEFLSTNVLFDPWLEGPAYYGSWHLFPKPVVKANELSPDAIVITHPHPDHFHLETLKEMDRNTPIYYPKFPSGIIEANLNSMKFKNQFATLFGDEVVINNEVKIQFLQPQSFWEDSSVLVKAGNWTWLNQNDAGSNMDDSLLPQNIDLLSASFDQGASGYPLTWGHLDEKKKSKMMLLSKQKLLRQLPFRASQVGAKYFLPFAGHWRLGLEKHQKFAALIPHTDLSEVTQSFVKNESNCEVLEILPGEEFDFHLARATENAASRYSYKIGFESNLEDLEFESQRFDIDSLKKSLQKLSLNSSAQRCEKVTFSVKIENSRQTFSTDFGDHSLEELLINISVTIPIRIAGLLASGEANWGHMAIGYWGNWTRSPDIYPPNFMRLLQVGNVQQFQFPREIQSTKRGGDSHLISEYSVADLIEINPDLVASILSSTGLPCIACSRSNTETLHQAFELHSINRDRQARALAELQAVVSNA